MYSIRRSVTEGWLEVCVPGGMSEVPGDGRRWEEETKR
jgi:hypothetical protein